MATQKIFWTLTELNLESEKQHSPGAVPRETPLMTHSDNLRPPFISCPYGISMALVSDGAFTARAGTMTESMCNLAAYIPPLFKWLPSAQGSDPIHVGEHVEDEGRMFRRLTHISKYLGSSLRSNLSANYNNRLGLTTQLHFFCGAGD